MEKIKIPRYIFASGGMTVAYLGLVRALVSFNDQKDRGSDFEGMLQSDDKLLENSDGYKEVFESVRWHFDSLPGFYTASLCSVLVMTSLIVVCDILHRQSLLDQTFWAKLGTSTERKHPVSSSEQLSSTGSLFKYYLNCQSSSAQVAAGTYISVRIICDGFLYGKLSSVIMALVLIAMGFVSYAWWGSQSEEAWLIDNFLMHVMILSIPLLHLTIRWPEIEFTLCFLFTLIGGMWYVTFKKNPSLAETVFWSMVVFSAAVIVCCTWLHGCPGNIELASAAIFFLLFGFPPKAADEDDGFYLGTSFFHAFEAVGWVILFEWFQTIPNICELQ